MNLKELTADWLKAHCYDGLFHADTCCGCSLGDLMPCGQPDEYCEPGYQGKSCECGGECASAIYREKITSWQEFYRAGIERLRSNQ